METKSLRVYGTILIIVSIISGSYNIAFSQADIFVNGEELNYVVYYGFIKLGEVKMKVTDKRSENEVTVYTSECVMRSYSGIPLVNLNSSFSSEMVWDGKDLFSRRFRATDNKEDGAVIKTEYKFNYDSGYVHVLKENNGKVEKDENIKFNTGIKFQDGLSLFYKARINSYSEQNFLIPVFMNEAETSVNYYFSSTVDDVSISIFENDVKCLRCSGVANFEGVFGLKGEFVGWFSNDHARIPIKSQLNVIIGNVTLELDSYKREGWKPPN